MYGKNWIILRSDVENCQIFCNIQKMKISEYFDFLQLTNVIEIA